jgi:uncharacterized damage-inducible protein DinB
MTTLRSSWDVSLLQNAPTHPPRRPAARWRSGRASRPYHGSVGTTTDDDKLDPARILSRYRAAPSLLAAALEHVRPRQLQVDVYTKGWTVADVVHHIADGDALWKQCILAGLGEAVPVFSIDWYWSLPQDSWSRRWLYRDRSIADSLALFRANRSITSAALAGTPDWWARPVRIRWEDGGVEDQTILEVVLSQADHALQHVGEISNALTRAAGLDEADAGRAGPD